VADDRVEVSVLVPVLDEAELIRDTADAMLAQHFAGGIEFLFLDGGSSDGTQAILEDLAAGDGRIRALDNPGRRQCRALNIGLREARGEYIARMDAHTYYPTDYIARGVARLKRGDVACVGGPQLPLGVGRWSRRIALAMQSPLGVGGAVFRRELSGEIETDTAFTGIWPRRVVEAVGGWDEEALVNEDGELAARIRAEGGRIVCVPEMAAECITRDSLRGLARQYYRYGWDRVRTLRKHPRTMRRSQALPPALVLATAAAAIGPRPLRRLARLGLGAYVAALGTEAVRLTAGAEQPRDAASVPLVLATMHCAWGIGFLVGCMSHGPPLAALEGLLKDRAA
jgi:succinoglycan biosynthesis protein ExoA